MNKYLMCLALALVAAIAVRVEATVTTSAIGNPINTTLNIPQSAGTFSCANVQISTSAATLVLAANTSAIRSRLYVINVSSIPMAGSTRVPDAMITPSASPTIVSASNFAKMPGVLLHPKAETQSLSQLTNADDKLEMAGSGVYQGAVYAVEESTTPTAGVAAWVTACEWY